VGLGLGVAVFVVGLVVTFAGSRVSRRVPGFAIAAVGAVLAVGSSSARPSWPVALTVALTLVPLVLVAAGLARRLDHLTRAGDASLDDDPR
jgi:hypothetical protein